VLRRHKARSTVGAGLRRARAAMHVLTLRARHRGFTVGEITFAISATVALQVIGAGSVISFMRSR